VLLVAIATAMALIFGKLSNQLRITSMYDNFIANITHELKSPLASIQLSLETLEARDMPEEQRKEFIRLMMEDSSRLNNLITSILEVAMLEEKRTVYELREYDADGLIRGILEDAIHQYKLGDTNAVVSGSLTKKCRADVRALKIAFNNLIDNAVKFSVGPADVNVVLSETNKHVIVDVADRGIGIAGKDLKQVFKKFQRVYSADSPNVKGTGLGLFWVREILRHHRGRVTAMSEGRGTGATFRVELPVSDARKRMSFDER
jgi:signal transduction histidine kinase